MNEEAGILVYRLGRLIKRAGKWNIIGNYAIRNYSVGIRSNDPYLMGAISENLVWSAGFKMHKGHDFYFFIYLTENNIIGIYPRRLSQDHYNIIRYEELLANPKSIKGIKKFSKLLESTIILVLYMIASTILDIMKQRNLNIERITCRDVKGLVQE